MSQATFFLNSLQKNYLPTQKKLRKIFNNESLEIKKVNILNKKEILKKIYKLGLLLELKNNFPSKVVLEIYDNKDYFRRNYFAQKKLDMVNPPELFGLISSYGIVREFLEGEFLNKAVSNKTNSLENILKNIKAIAKILRLLHNLKIKSLPKFLFKEVNLKIEEKNFIESLGSLPTYLKPLEKKYRECVKILFQKIKKFNKEMPISLIYGDCQPNNIVLKNGLFYFFDFDTLEIGNPARDLGRFFYHLEIMMLDSHFPEKHEVVKKFFLKNYLIGDKKIFGINFEKSIFLYYLQMKQYFIRGKIWEIQKIKTNKNKLEEIERLLTAQENLILNI